MQDSPFPRPWRARAVTGAGRGRELRVPTINLAPEEIPAHLGEGIYACTALLEYGDGSTEGPFMAAVHYGPRPVFRDTVSFEIHLIDALPKNFPVTVEVTIRARLRDVRDFPSKEALVEQIGRDVAEARDIFEGKDAKEAKESKDSKEK